MELYEKETVTCAEMKALEKAGDEAGLSYYEMMENAGTAAAERIASLMADKGLADLETVLFCGNGNNGGDGFVAARILRGKGFPVTIILCEGDPKTEDARKNFDRLPDGTTVLRIEKLRAGDMFRLAQAPLAVDAVYGTGFHGELRGTGAEAVRLMNVMGQDQTVVSLDIPSGLPGDLGLDVENPLAPLDPPPVCVSADVTLTFHAKKPVHDFLQARKYVGRVEVLPIGLEDVLSRESAK